MHGQRQKTSSNFYGTSSVSHTRAQRKSLGGKMSFYENENEQVSCQKSCLIRRLNYLVFSDDFCAAFLPRNPICIDSQGLILQKWIQHDHDFALYRTSFITALHNTEWIKINLISFAFSTDTSKRLNYNCDFIFGSNYRWSEKASGSRKQ